MKKYKKMLRIAKKIRNSSVLACKQYNTDNTNYFLAFISYESKTDNRKKAGAIKRKLYKNKNIFQLNKKGVRHYEELYF